MRRRLYSIFKTANVMVSTKPFKKALTKFYKYRKNIYFKTTRTFFTGHPI